MRELAFLLVVLGATGGVYGGLAFTAAKDRIFIVCPAVVVGWIGVVLFSFSVGVVYGLLACVPVFVILCAGLITLYLIFRRT